MNSFSQKNFSLKKTFVFKEDGIDIAFSDKDGDFSMFIHFDRIEPRKEVRVHTRKKPLILRYGLIIAVLTLARGFISVKSDLKTTIIVIGLAVLIGVGSWIYYSITKLKYYAVKLQEGKSFMVIYDKPTVLEAQNFIDDIFEKRKSYYRNKYFHIDYDSNKKDEVSKMNWLKEEDIITEGELAVVIEEINESVSD